MATDDYIAFKSKLEFQRKTQFYMCFNCLCPHRPYNIFGHPSQTGDCAEHQEDVIKPLAYGIWFQEPVRQRVFEQLGLRLDYFRDMDQYIQWICQKQDIPNSMYNIHELVLAYYSLYPHGGKRSKSRNIYRWANVEVEII